jgi:hypothetical protein
MLALAAVPVLGWAVARADTVTVGLVSLTSNSPTLNAFAGGIPVFQGDSSGGYVLASPVDGRIVSWSFLSGGAATGDQYRLRVLRPQDMTGTNWAGAGTSAPAAVASAGGTDAVQGPFSVSLPIKAGDRIGLQPVDASDDTPLEAGVNGQDGFRSFLGAIADGSSEAIDPGSAGDNGQVVPIQATVAAAPVNSALPAITGTATVGQTLSCSTGTWSGGPTFTYQWLADGTPVAGATATTYAIPDVESGHQLTCAVTASNLGGSVTATSAPTEGVKPGAAPPPANSASPVISGTARQFETLSTTPGLWTGGVTSFAYQWFRCPSAAGESCAPVSGAVQAAYTLTRDDIGSTMRVVVTATNGSGSTPAISAPTGIVQRGVITANLTITPIETCTGLMVRIDGSGSVSPDGISAITISEVSLAASGDYEPDLFGGALTNAVAFQVAVMPQGEVDSRTYAVFHQATLVTSFTWSRLEYPFYAGDPDGFKNFAVDPVGIELDVRDYAGNTAMARGAVLFQQNYSNESRADCPKGSMVLGRTASAALFTHQATVVPAKAGQQSAVGATLSCTQAVTCTGVLSMGPLKCRACGRAGATKKPVAPVVYARSFFSIAAHHRVAIRAALTPAGRRLVAGLRHGRSRRVAVTITSVGPAGGSPVSRTSTILLRRR